MPTHGPKVGTKVASHAIPMPIWSSRVGMRIAPEGMGGPLRHNDYFYILSSSHEMEFELKLIKILSLS